MTEHKMTILTAEELETRGASNRGVEKVRNKSAWAGDVWTNNSILQLIQIN